MSQTSCSNEETIYIGDMEVDKIAAEKAKIDFLYAEWGYGKCKSTNSIKIYLSYGTFNLKKKLNIIGLIPADGDLQDL